MVGDLEYLHSHWLVKILSYHVLEVMGSDPLVYKVVCLKGMPDEGLKTKLYALLV